MSDVKTDTRNGGRVLKVCHLAYTFYENDNRVLRYAEALRGRGSEVDVVALRRPGQSWQGQFRDVRVFRIQRRSVTERWAWMYLAKIAWFAAKAALFLAWMNARRRYDIIHVHNVPDFLVFAAIIPKIMGTRVILDIHDALPELYAGKFGAAERSSVVRTMLLVERLSCRFADHVIIANDIWRDKIVERAVPATKSTTILNYPDLRLFRPLPSARDADGKFVILYPGSLNRHQGVEVLIRAFKHIQHSISCAQAHIYGEGPALPQLKQLTEDLGLTGRVQFIRPLRIDQIPAVMAAADVGVEPKLATGFSDEALSTKILEFMACRVPVIVSRTTVHQRYFHDGVVKFVASGDAAALAAALTEVYKESRYDERLKDEAYDFALRLSWQQRACDYYRIVESLTACPNAYDATPP